MEAKLIKVENTFYLKQGGTILGTSSSPNLSASIRYSLSLKNCIAIERGYDIELLSIEYASHFKDDDGTSDVDFMMGFLKAIEILGDKKFSEDDMRIAYNDGMDNIGSDGDYIDRPDEDFNDTIQSLQQTEWEVEIEMEEKSTEDIQKELGTFGHDEGLTEAEYNKYIKTNSIYKPKLDADGCIVLKRK